MWAHDGPDGWAWLWMVPMMALFWAPIVALVVWLVRGGAPGGRSPPDDLDAAELARRAYARGELSRERFNEVIQDLRESRTERGDEGGT